MAGKGDEESAADFYLHASANSLKEEFP